MNRNRGMDFIGGILAFIIGVPLFILSVDFLINNWPMVFAGLVTLFGLLGLLSQGLDNRHR